MPVFVCAYWRRTDLPRPLAAVLLLARQSLGVMLTVAIITCITSDVALNAWVPPTFILALYGGQSLLPYGLAERAQNPYLTAREVPISTKGGLRGA